MRWVGNVVSSILVATALVGSGVSYGCFPTRQQLEYGGGLTAYDSRSFWFLSATKGGAMSLAYSSTAIDYPSSDGASIAENTLQYGCSNPMANRSGVTLRVSAEVERAQQLAQQASHREVAAVARAEHEAAARRKRSSSR